MWFRELFGFDETGYDATRRQLSVVDGRLRSQPNGASFGVGTFSTPSLGELRERGLALRGRGRLRVAHEVIGDVLPLHALTENRGALFQVASQFNCLEFPGPSTVPEDGVTGYAHDPTQGPACALAAAAATVYRNYFVPVGGQEGQTRTVQIDNLEFLASTLGAPEEYWRVQNGYTFADGEQLARLAVTLAARDREELLGWVRVGLQSEIEVTFVDRFTPTPEAGRPVVSQAFCSAISCAYSGVPTAAWQPLATLVLDASYEATLWAAALERAAGCGSGKVWLTMLGGGAFGNERRWIAAAIGRAVARLDGVELDVRIAHYRRPDPALEADIGEHIAAGRAR